MTTAVTLITMLMVEMVVENNRGDTNTDHDRRTTAFKI